MINVGLYLCLLLQNSNFKNWMVKVDSIIGNKMINRAKVYSSTQI